MRKIIRSDENLEESVRPLLAALKVPKLSDACKILFVNGDCLTLSTELEQIGLVTLEGEETEDVEASTIVMEQAKLELMKIFQQVFPRFIQEYSETFAAITVEMAEIQDENERQSLITAKIIEKTKGQGDKQLYKSMMPFIGGAIRPFIELMIGGLYKFYFEHYRAQHQAIMEFNDVIVSLRKIGLLTPFLNIAFCPSCNNYELVFSKKTAANNKCPKCGLPWAVLAVNEFPESFAQLKKRSKDPPVFISAYLKSKSPLHVNIFPNAELTTEDGSIEIDVYLPDISTGIECKCYTNNLSVAMSTINSEVGKIKQQIDNYLKVGLKRVIVVTNYNESDANKLRTLLKEILKDYPGLDEWKILGYDMPAFITFLDAESKKINDYLDTSIQKRFDGIMKKQLTKPK